jgi:hypothetical protein
LLLVDHRSYWEGAAIAPGGPGSWFDGRADRAGRLGHAELAQLLFSTLWRCRPDELSTDLTHSREDAEILQEGW